MALHAILSTCLIDSAEWVDRGCRLRGEMLIDGHGNGFFNQEKYRVTFQTLQLFLRPLGSRMIHTRTLTGETVAA